MDEKRMMQVLVLAYIADLAASGGSRVIEVGLTLDSMVCTYCNTLGYVSLKQDEYGVWHVELTKRALKDIGASKE